MGHLRGGILLIIAVLLLATGCLALQTPAQPTQVASNTPDPFPTHRTTAAAATPSQTEGAVAAAGEPSIGDPYAPELGNTGYDVQRYTIRLTLDPAVAGIIQAHVTIEALSQLDDLSQISLDFIGFEIESVRSGEALLEYQREDDKLWVSFPRPLALGESFNLEVVYSGPPELRASKYLPFTENVGLFFKPDLQQIFVVAEPDGARFWYPCNDHPRDKALFRIELTVPEEITAAANGVLVDTQTEIPNAFPDGRAGDRFIWEHDSPMATYLATIVIGDYELFEGTSPGGTPLRSYILPQYASNYRDMQLTVGEMVDWMSQMFGGYPFETFGYATVDQVNVSLETQTLVILSGGIRETTMAHELAHMWFGDWVSLDSWADMWRNEGFATYVTALWMTRDDPAALAHVLEGWAQPFQQNPTRYPLNDPPKQALFANDSYYKGALLAHALRYEIGDEAFFGGLRTYFERYGGDTASHEQFVQVLEEASGKELDPFFEMWFAPGELPPVPGLPEEAPAPVPGG